jgi:hypothetical protein
MERFTGGIRVAETTITSIQWTIKHCSITQLNLIYLRFLFITVYRYNELYLMT